MRYKERKKRGSRPLTVCHDLGTLHIGQTRGATLYLSADISSTSAPTSPQRPSQRHPQLQPLRPPPPTTPSALHLSLKPSYTVILLLLQGRGRVLWVERGVFQACVILHCLREIAKCNPAKDAKAATRSNTARYNPTTPRMQAKVKKSRRDLAPHTHVLARRTEQPWRNRM